ncbi:putative sulfate exporter family transporter [bacterium]|nr:MAG: putative sulfate exporter family transporter [bacterium]
MALHAGGVWLGQCTVCGTDLSHGRGCLRGALRPYGGGSAIPARGADTGACAHGAAVAESRRDRDGAREAEQRFVRNASSMTSTWPARLPGLALSLVLAVLAAFIGRSAPIIGAPIFAILFGIILRNAVSLPSWSSPGVAFTSKKVLQGAIVLLGFGIDLPGLWSVGRSSAGVMLVTLAVGLIGGLVLGRVLRVDSRSGLLIAVGTSICGASAIAAIAPIVAAEASEIAYAVSTIFLYNVIGVFLFPFLGHVMHMSDTAFGIWAGTAVNDTSSVVAAGYSFSRTAGTIATIVKLARTVMIIPVSLGVAAAVAWRARESRGLRRERRGIAHVIPWFILAFVIAAAIDSTGLLPHAMMSSLAEFGGFLIVVALAAVGLSVDMRAFGSAGVRPIALGAAIWGLVAITSLIIQHAV